MTKARTNASASPAVGRNMLINGAMNVAQRGTSQTGLGANGATYLIDRFYCYANATAGRFTKSQVADGPNGISANCMKIDCTTADSSIAAAENLTVLQAIEGQNVQRIGKGVTGAQQITASFYCKASASFTFAANLYDNDNNRHISALFDVTTDWNRIVLTFPADVDDGSSPFGDDNAASLYFQIGLHVGSNESSGTLQTTWANYVANTTYAGIDSILSNTANNFFLTGVQLEVGPVATEFEQEDISTTLQKCQRYFCKVTGSSGAAYQRFARGHCANATTGAMGTFLPQNMRAFPTLGSTGTASNYAVHHGAGTTALSANPATEGGSDAFLSNSTNNHVVIVATTAADGLTAGQGCSLNANGSEAAFLSFDAEL